MQNYKETITIGQLDIRFLLDGADTNNQMVVFEFIVPAGAKVPVAHYHVEVDEMVYCLQGTLSSYVNGNRMEVTEGQSCFIPRGAVHYHDNHTAGTVKVLCVLTPASIGPAYFRELKEVINMGAPPDPKKIGEVMLRHGLVPAV
jgi:quercetin dioxygenase-like cupin family protein